MAVSVGYTELQGTYAPSQRCLKSVICGASFRFQAVNWCETDKRAEGTGIRLASNRQMNRCLSGNSHTAGCGHRTAVVVQIVRAPNRLTLLVRILRERERMNLIEVALTGEMRAFATNVRAYETVAMVFPKICRWKSTCHCCT